MADPGPPVAAATIDAETLDFLVRNAVLAADQVAIGFQGTPAAKTRAVVHRALEMLIANRMITVVPRGDWPDWITLDPPYLPPRWGPLDG